MMARSVSVHGLMVRGLFYSRTFPYTRRSYQEEEEEEEEEDDDDEEEDQFQRGSMLSFWQIN
jgi:hypothetical protein